MVGQCGKVKFQPPKRFTFTLPEPKKNLPRKSKVVSLPLYFTSLRTLLYLIKIKTSLLYEKVYFILSEHDLFH